VIQISQWMISRTKRDITCVLDMISITGDLCTNGTINHTRTVCAQIIAGLDLKVFRRCAARHPMVRNTPALSPYDHFAVMVFAQLSYRDSLRA